MRFHSYYRPPVTQTPLENCFAHNGSLIPIPGRDVMVQAWHQGGISVFAWIDRDNPPHRLPPPSSQNGGGGPLFSSSAKEQSGC
jgi:hypothetical protein